ncbi:hypothetical protein AA313_de0210464 [Arthrobotrys entomopaga]|nr:hypothetical protein AA313_de0210464 [Arthrobotrys entomopaga]
MCTDMRKLVLSGSLREKKSGSLQICRAETGEGIRNEIFSQPDLFGILRVAEMTVYSFKFSLHPFFPETKRANHFRLLDLVSCNERCMPYNPDHEKLQLLSDSLGTVLETNRNHRRLEPGNANIPCLPKYPNRQAEKRCWCQHATELRIL